MPKRSYIFCYLGVFFSIIIFFIGCSTYENVTGYFNTYYNTKKLFTDAISEIEKTPQKDRDTNYFAAYTVPKSAADKLDKVIEKCNKIIQLFPRSDWIENSLFMMAQSYVYQGETETAIRKFKEFLETFPNSDQQLDVKLWRAKALYQSKKEDDVLREIKDIITEAQTAEKQDILLELYMLEAQIYFDRGEYEVAIAKCENTSMVAGDDKLLAIVHYQLGQCYERRNEYTKAAKSYEMVNQYEPDITKEFKSRLKNGVMLTKAEQYDDALNIFETLKDEKLKPEERGLVELETANTFITMDDTSKAFELYKLIDSLYKRTDASAQGYFQRGLLYETKYLNLIIARTFYDKAKNEYAASEITPLAQRKTAYLTNYFKHYENLAKYDSLLNKALHPDTINARADSLHSNVDSTKLKNITHTITDSTHQTLDTVRTTDLKNPDDADNPSKSAIKTSAENSQPPNDSSKLKSASIKPIIAEKKEQQLEKLEDTLLVSSKGNIISKDDSTKEKTYIVGTWEKDRECLWNIAKKKDVYDNPLLWRKIYERNYDKITDPDQIKPKLILIIPLLNHNLNIEEKFIAQEKKKFNEEIEQKKLEAIQTSADSNITSKDVPIQQKTAITQNVNGKDTIVSTILDRQKAGKIDSLKNGLNQKQISEVITKGVKEELLTKGSKDSLKNEKNTALSVSLIKLSPDSLKNLIARTEFELAGLLFLEMNLPDSALAWYKSLVQDYPSSMLTPRAYYAMAEIYRTENDTSKVDSLYKIILSQYDKSEYAEQVKKILGMEITSTDINQADSVYRSALELFQVGETKKALHKFDQVVKLYPNSPLVPKSLYAIGWILETVVVDNDSATSIYKKLIKEYPTSVYATEVKSKVAVKEDPKSLQQFVKVKEIQPVAKTETSRQKPEDIDKSREKDQQKIDQPLKGKDQEININPDEQDPDEETPPEEDEDDGGGGK